MISGWDIVEGGGARMRRPVAPMVEVTDTDMLPPLEDGQLVGTIPGGHNNRWVTGWWWVW